MINNHGLIPAIVTLYSAADIALLRKSSWSEKSKILTSLFLAVYYLHETLVI